MEPQGGSSSKRGEQLFSNLRAGGPDDTIDPPGVLRCGAVMYKGDAHGKTQEADHEVEPIGSEDVVSCRSLGDPDITGIS